jgi:MEDS: MEthanogen/methylotroph, DcmR Sensory domain
MDAEYELPTAIDAVLRGETFVSSRCVAAGLPRKAESTRSHAAGFYSNEDSFLDAFTDFMGTALKAGNAVIVVATESHRTTLLTRLQVPGSDIRAAIEQGRYISLDAAETLSTFMVNNEPDPVRFLKAMDELIGAAAKAATGEHPRVAACGECAPLLCERGNAEVAIRLEHLWDKVANSYDVDILCGYSLRSFQEGSGSQIFERLSAEHSTVHCR